MKNTAKATKATTKATATKKALAPVAPRSAAFKHDARVLAAYPVGSTITKEYRPRGGRPVVVGVEVVADGYRYNGRLYATLSAIGNAVRKKEATDGMWFFGITDPHAKGSK